VHGRAATRTLDRLAASMGALDGAPIEFEAVNDVPDAGVLLALPGLLENGLLAHSREIFSMPEGFYPLESIFLLLALMALARIGSVEQLRYVAPGEWGKLLGLDRIPEVRTLRQKVSALCSQEGRAERWSGILAKEWMEAEPECAGVFYLDGHVRVYHGTLSDLPRRYIAARSSVCGEPRTTGSTPWMDAPFSASPKRSIRGSPKSSANWLRGSCRMCPLSPARAPWRPTRCSTA